MKCWHGGSVAHGKASFSFSILRLIYLKHRISTNICFTFGFSLINFDFWARCFLLGNAQRTKRPTITWISDDYFESFLLPQLLVCSWCHGSPVGGQEQNLLCPLGATLYFHLNSSRKNSFCIEPLYGRLVTWLQTKNNVWIDRPIMPSTDYPKLIIQKFL